MKNYPERIDGMDKSKGFNYFVPVANGWGETWMVDDVDDPAATIADVVKVRILQIRLTPSTETIDGLSYRIQYDVKVEGGRETLAFHGQLHMTEEAALEAGRECKGCNEWKWNCCCCDECGGPPDECHPESQQCMSPDDYLEREDAPGCDR